MMIGKIIHINFDKGFGFVSSKTTQNYYFKIRDCNYHLNKYDIVYYEVEETTKGICAKFIRKTFLNNSGLIFVPRINSQHIHLDLDKYLPEVINEVKSDNYEDIIELEYKFPYKIGQTHCLQTHSNDNVIYGIRKGRLGHSRFVLNSYPQDCNHLFAIFKKTEEVHIILTIFIGKKAAREPWDEQATYSDLLFWQNHALIYDEQIIIPGSELKECPWVLNMHSICKINI